MNRLVRWLDERLYPGFERNWDDQLFRHRILDHLSQRSMEVLDLGAGAGIVSQINFRGIAAHICGVDPDPRVESNPYLDEGKVGFGESLPYPDARFDMVFADNVLEHLAEPEKVFAEVARVLRPGGVFLVKTPNRYHYMPLIARLMPHRFHQWINRKRGRAEEDTFPTLYRANTNRDIHRIADSAGLTVTHMEFIEGRPEYLWITAFTYLFGWLYE
ncbi:class I SAM-dependent methyltransferase [Candidatus Thiosymbion oneisti]|uniref:class I SAM-dependent methyltransferase n=1 Tax=Candidatus Thiosymbion oneisti TaxID=589554 RepID=UPI00105EFEF2|nr:class I SAM-dependent methyltransferase [Candidatus Thiosymbion oneisti]